MISEKFMLKPLYFFIVVFFGQLTTIAIFVYESIGKSISFSIITIIFYLLYMNEIKIDYTDIIKYKKRRIIITIFLLLSIIIFHYLSIKYGY